MVKITVFSKCGVYGLIGSLVILASCKGSLNSEDSGVKATTSTQIETQECPATPGGSLTDPTSIDIIGKTVQKSGSLRSKDNIGFTFSGKQGQKLNYSYNDEVCVWIFAPDNSILSGTELPTDGIYTIHLTSLKGTTSFDIEVGLSEPTIAEQATPAPAQVVVIQQPPTQVNSQPAEQAPQPSSSPQPAPSTVDFTQNEAVGWIRIGAVNNPSGFASIGEPLISTAQPVTITPMVVPEINTQVVTTTGVNLRRNVPQPPNYKLEEKINVLLTNQRLKILDLKTFVDNTASSEHTVVWAEVGIP